MTHTHPRRRLLALAALAGLGGGASLARSAALAAPRAPLLTGFLAAPTDQVAVPGMLAGAEITPEGDLYTGWAEYELRFGRRLRAWDQPTRTLPDPGLPLLSSTQSDGAVRYTQTVFAVAVGGRPVAYDTVAVTNGAGSPREARVSMALAYTRGAQVRGVHGLATGAYRYERPAEGGPPGLYDQPGQAFSPAFRYTTAGRDIDRSGLLLLRGPAGASRPVRSPRANPLTETHGARLFTAVLRPHGELTLTWQIPLDPPAAGTAADADLDRIPLGSARAALLRTWGAEEAGMMKIELPEARVDAAYRAAITEMLSSRYRSPEGWVQASNKLQYQAFWIRDASIETQALDLAGLHRQAEQNLGFLDTFQQPDGLFISRPEQYDGWGQALWALDQHAQLTQNRAYAAAQLERIGAAIGWLSSATAADPLGLLPAGDPGDDELAYGHITGDDLWAAAGLRCAIADAILAGRQDLAVRWRELEVRFEAALHRAIAAAVSRSGHIPPVLDATGGQDWGNYYAAYPVQVLDPDSPAVRATIRWAREHMVQGLATYDDGRSLHDYLGFSIFESQLSGGDASGAIEGLYAELAHTTSTDEGWEWDVPKWGFRATDVDLAPHGTFAGDYVALLRNMLLAETPSGGVDLLRGASPAWLAPGQEIKVVRAPTDHGLISYRERASAHAETLTWSSSLAPGSTLSWTLPAWARHPRVAGARLSSSVVTLPGTSGSLTVTFTGRRPRQSYALTVAALDAAYRARHRPAPLVPATG